MIGEVVNHPIYGSGQVLAIYRNGREWLVRFENGLRFRRASSEFSADGAPTIEPGPAVTAAFSPPPPMSLPQLDARKLIESLRLGIAPAQHVPELTVNLTEERASIIRALNQTHQQGGDVRAVVGEYGYGKSHIVELTALEALERGFLVATVSLDLLELPPHRSFEIYREAMHHLRYPNSDELGLAPLLEKIADQERTTKRLGAYAADPPDPLSMALTAFAGTNSTRQRRAWSNWLAGGQRTPAMNKAQPRGMRFPSIYKVGHNARQITYLFTGVSALARLAGYSGLCVLIDEAESYSLLAPYQRPKAGLFFQAAIYAALREHQTRLREAQIPQHRWRDYPVAYEQGQGFFFLFTVTRSDNRLPMSDWLDEEQILYLEPDAPAEEVGHFLQKVLAYHRTAYGYEPDDRQQQVRRGAAEHLAQGIRNGRLSMRQVVRIAVELFDLLYLYPDYQVASLLDELRSQVR